MRLEAGALRLHRVKNRPATLTPQIADTFGSAVGALRFTRDTTGKIDGFLLEAGRVRRLRFRKM